MGGRRVAGSHCLRGWRAGPSPPPHEDVDHPPKGDGGGGAPMPRLGLGSVPSDEPLLPLDRFVQRSKGPWWSSASTRPPTSHCVDPRLPEETGLPVQWTQCSETPGSELDLGAGEARQEVAGMWATPGRLPEISAEPGLQPHRCMRPPRRVDIHDDPCACPVAFPDTHPPMPVHAVAYSPHLPRMHPHTSARRGPDHRNSARTVTWASCAHTSCTLVCPHSSALHSGRPGFKSRAESLLQESPVLIFQTGL